MEAKLSEQWMGLAYKLAGSWKTKLASNQEDYEDLVGEALEILVRAEQTYSPDKGAFSTYAKKCISHRFKNLLDEKYATKRSLYTAYTYSSLETEEGTYEELYADCFAYHEDYIQAIGLYDLVSHFCTPEECYLIQLRLKDFSSEEQRKLYANYLGKKNVNISRDMGILRKKVQAALSAA